MVRSDWPGPRPITFEEFLVHIFDHADSNWHWGIDAPFWDYREHGQLALEHLTGLLANPAALLPRYSPDQIGTGISYLVSPPCSDYAFLFIDHGLPLEQRLAGIRNISKLYTDLFPHVCSPEPSEGGETKADYICYMLWDVVPLYPRTKSPFSKKDGDVLTHWEEHLCIEQACLDALELSLASRHPVCLEGTIHGLGHWAASYPERTKHLLRQLGNDATLSTSLRAYARDAITGNIQ